MVISNGIFIVIALIAFLVMIGAIKYHSRIGTLMALGFLGGAIFFKMIGAF